MGAQTGPRRHVRRASHLQGWAWKLVGGALAAAVVGGSAATVALAADWSQRQTLTARQADGSLDFGIAVSVSGDGSTALVGAPSGPIGLAYVFRRVGSTWGQPQQLSGDGAWRDEFGISVSLSNDGATALVGSSTPGTGAAYVFHRSGTTWTRQQKLTGDESACAFGYSVALSGDGATALVGAYQARPSGTGAAYVFHRTGTTWNQQQRLTAGDRARGDEFGFYVSLGATGNTAVIGAPGKKSTTGAAYVFRRSGTNWSQQQKLIAGDGRVGDQFGASASLSGDGTTVLIGAAGKNSLAGAAYVFNRNGVTWSQKQELTASKGADYDGFGSSISVNWDGSTALVGALGENSASGAVYVFSRSRTGWSQGQKLTARKGAPSAYFGLSVAVSSDGFTALIGVPGSKSGTGEADVFVCEARDQRVTG